MNSLIVIARGVCKRLGIPLVVENGEFIFNNGMVMMVRKTVLRSYIGHPEGVPEQVWEVSADAGTSEDVVLDSFDSFHEGLACAVNKVRSLEVQGVIDNLNDEAMVREYENINRGIYQ